MTDLLTAILSALAQQDDEMQIIERHVSARYEPIDLKRRGFVKADQPALGLTKHLEDQCGK